MFGVSTQDRHYQQEMVKRLHLPFSVLSDSEFILTKALNLPTLVVENNILLKRLTMIVINGIIKKVFYPVFPPDKHPIEVLDWLSHHVASF